MNINSNHRLQFFSLVAVTKLKSHLSVLTETTFAASIYKILMYGKKASYTDDIPSDILYAELKYQ